MKLFFQKPARWMLAAALWLAPTCALADDYLRELQSQAIAAGKSEAAHWGYDREQYALWGTHSNRLIPVYTYGTCGAGAGVDLRSYTRENSPYRSAEAIRRLYGQVPENTLAPDADYFDQTNL